VIIIAARVILKFCLFLYKVSVQFCNKIIHGYHSRFLEIKLRHLRIVCRSFLYVYI